VTFVHGDAQILPFQDNNFDIVISNFGICHVPDQPRALAEASRVLRSGGHFAMTVWCGPDVSPCFEILYGARLFAASFAGCATAGGWSLRLIPALDGRSGFVR
jgi:ubiquinone/menaquinone biosynthesis C-methylase UbiE